MFKKINGRYPNYIPAFTHDHVANCGVNLGPEEPPNYPAKYWLDDHFPVKDVETNAERIE